MPADPHERPDPRERRAPRKKPITVERITDAALEVVATEGYDALTIRRVAAVLGTGPSSLYAHIVTKDDIDDLLIGRLYAEVTLPEPDPAAWREQLVDVYTQIRDLYLKYPGISRAALAMVPTSPETLRVGEGILAILLAGGIEPRTAGWARDALSLYVSAYALEQSLVRLRRGHQDPGWVLGRDELLAHFTALPAERFPQTRAHATALTSGTGPDRFDFTLGLLLNNLRPAGG
ncbi:TetR/AcrR family transcriptional regulator [Streptomyces sp. NPDC090083]|uniref:TetR/AcrR family transcriptional regulator n=1 Tax=Streptomyces sp. NPDC090083 TaxID=3365941 RepID=UPI00380643F1